MKYSEKDIDITRYLEEYAPGHMSQPNNVVDDISLQGHLQRYDWALSILRKENRFGKILDIGCGLGFGSIKLIDRASLVIGIDFHPEVINYAQSKYSHVYDELNFHVADALNLPFASHTFNVVTSFELIEHLPVSTVSQYLFEVKRVLKTNGVAFITTPNATYRKTKKLEMYPFHQKEYDIEEFQEILLEHFKDVQIFGQRYSKQSLRKLEQQIGLSAFFRLKNLIPQSLKNKISMLLGWDSHISENWLISADEIELSLGLLAICR